MNKDTVYLFVEESIGAGKSTFIQHLKKYLPKDSYIILGEGNIDISILHNYYQHIINKENSYNKYGFILQNEIINQRVKQLEESETKKYVIFDRSILSTRIFTNFMLQQEYITKKEAKSILKRTDKLERLFKNRIVVYLKTDSEKEYTRIKERNRELEEGVPQNYFKALTEFYEQGVKETYHLYAKEDLPEPTTEQYSDKVVSFCKRMSNLSDNINQKYVIGILYNSSRQIYLSQRKDPTKEYFNYYQVPGGRIEFGETAEAACIREIYEETGISVKEKLKYLGQHKKVDDVKGKTCKVYIVQINEKPLLKEPHKNTEWKAYTIEEMYNQNKKLTPSLEYCKHSILTEVSYKKKARRYDDSKKIIRKLKKLTKDSRKV